MKNLLIKYTIIGIFVCIFIVFLDQITKSWAIKTLYHSIQITSFFSLTLSFNYGISFGILNKPDQQQIILIIIAICIIFSLIFSLIKMQNKSTLLIIAFSFIIGGAISNVIDRLVYGAVIDFLDFHYGKYFFPIFNIADIAICCGVGLLIMKETLLKEEI